MVDAWFVFGGMFFVVSIILLICAIREIGRDGSFSYTTLLLLALFWLSSCIITGYFWENSKVVHPMLSLYVSIMYGIRSWGTTIIGGFIGLLCAIGVWASLSHSGEVTAEGRVNRPPMPNWLRRRGTAPAARAEAHHEPEVPATTPAVATATGGTAAPATATATAGH